MGDGEDAHRRGKGRDGVCGSCVALSAKVGRILVGSLRASRVGGPSWLSLMVWDIIMCIMKDCIGGVARVSRGEFRSQ
jgi:hypothetical protein